MKDSHVTRRLETVPHYKLDALLLNEIQKVVKAHVADQAEISRLHSVVAEQRAAMTQLLNQVSTLQATLAHSRSEGGNRLLAATTSTPTTTTPEAEATSGSAGSRAGQ